MTGDKARLAAAYQHAQVTVSMIALPIGFGFAGLAGLLVNLAVGDRWDDAIPIIQVLSVIFALQTLSSAVQPLAMALGDTRALFWRDLTNLGIRLPLIIVGFMLGGLMGVVYARGSKTDHDLDSGLDDRIMQYIERRGTVNGQGMNVGA